MGAQDVPAECDARTGESPLIGAWRKMPSCSFSVINRKTSTNEGVGALTRVTEAALFWTASVVGEERFCARRSERHQNVEELLAVARLLNVHELAMTAIGHSCLGDLVERDGVDGADVLRPDDAGDLKVADLVVDPHLLVADDDEVAVGQDLRHQHGDMDVDLVGAGDLAGAVDRAVAAGSEQLGR